ncbi:MAG: AAA family ATPase [Candidatus Micrarchaeia archaeon]|jgi:chromosome segregation protein
MLYLKNMSIKGFKSIKSSELLFSKGFTCIVGPNGSGKSNICDALLFGLGENALHRLRVDKLEGLINDARKSKKGSVAKAYVKLEFAGDESIEIERVARSDGKSAFRLNGKHVTRQEVLEVLRSHKMDANETNTITQGEINKLLELSPKERRELIEVTAGIKEFEDKKKEALKELDKVNIRIGEAKIMLNERSGFLEELAKEKEAAEKYISMSSRMKALNYSVLLGKQKLVQEELEKLEKDILALEQQKAKLEDSIKEYNEKISELGMERQSLAKSLTEGTTAMGEVNKKLEIANNELVKLSVEIEGLGKEKENIEQRISLLETENESTQGKIGSNNSALTALRAELAKINISELPSEENNADFEEKMLEIDKKIEEKEAELQEKNSQLARIQADLYVESSKYELLKSELASKRASPEKSSAKDLADELAKLKSSLEELISKEKEEEAILAELRKSSGEIDAKLLELKEQRAMSRQGADIGDSISAKFGEKEGFFGKASKLISYKSEYALAVEAAAGNKLEYFVVDSIETANKIIKYLRENNIGRATFIPINEISVGSRAKVQLKPIIELVEYDKKFEKVFQYIFFDTYLIDSIANAKAFGLGHRYVTIDGDLLEHSGIVSGGVLKKLSIAAIERIISDLSKEKDALAEKINASLIRLNELRKEEALAKMKIEEKGRALDAELKKEEKEKKELEEKEKELAKIGASLEAMHSKLDSVFNKIEELKKEISSLKGERARLYEESMAIAKAFAKSTSKKERERIEQERKKAEEIKIRIAELQKENEMLSKRIEEIKNEISAKKAELKDVISKIEEKNRMINSISKEKAKLEEKIKSSSEANKHMYEKLEELESKIAKLSNEQGKLSAEASSLGSRLQDAKMRRSQLEVRLGDLRAEVSVYANENLEIIEGKVEEMEREAAMLNEKIKELGSVNLKAPEIYKEKEKDVAEAKSKVEMLENERSAVLKMIEEIDAKKYSIFMETFNTVSKNFSKLYSYVSEDKAEIVLSDEKDPFNSELLIKLKTKDNVSKRAESLSGGEKSMLLLTLVFAIHMYKPSSIYIFDEIDSALDKENSKKLSQLLKQLSSNSQFIVVSHNDTLISNADAAIGVAKVNGESRIFGLQVSSIINNMSAVDEKRA